MVTGKYVEVYREAAAPGERRRYTKRFLSTKDGDFREWTEREWRMLARLVGHGLRHVPDVVQYDRRPAGGDALVQTYDAGVTVAHWATLLPVQREGRVQRHIFQDCAHWWALARHLLLALHEIHPLRLVHLDLKADNICVPLTPTSFNPTSDEQLFPAFESIALIDFAFSVVTGETLTRPLPIGWKKTYRYQSPRLLRALTAGQKGDFEPTRQLDWRCDMYSLAALLEALLPLPGEISSVAGLYGWTDSCHVDAKMLLLEIRQSHDQDIGEHLPHLALAAACAVQLDIRSLAASLKRGWALAARPGSVASEGNASATTPPQTHLLRQPFAAPTEVLPQSESRKSDEWIVAHFGSEAVAAPVADPSVTATNALSVADSFVTVTEVLPHPQSRSTDAEGEMFSSIPTQPAAASTVLESDITPSLDASAVTDAERYGLLITTPTAPLASSLAPLDASSNPSLEAFTLKSSADAKTHEVSGSIHERPADTSPSDRPPAAFFRHDENEKRPRAVYLLPILALVIAMAWWLAHSSSPTDEPHTPGTSSADADVANSTGKVEPAAAPDPATSSAARVGVEVIPAAIDPPPSLAKGGRQPARTPGRAAPVTDAQQPVQAAAPSPEARDERTAERAQETLAAVVPLIAGIAEPRVAHVLSVAHQAQDASEDRRTVVAAATIGVGAFPQAGSGVAAGGPALSRQLNAAANQAFYQGHSAAQAYALQRRAFVANPLSVEVAGNLAFYGLKLDPPRAEESRELAIYALALATRAKGRSRPEDWGNLAVASALSGRPNEAKDAMLVLLSVSPNVNRSCQSALSSVASHGQKMLIPAETLLLRAQNRIDVTQAPQCFSPSPRGR